MAGESHTMMCLLMLACFVPSLVTALCFPDESLEECLKRQTVTTTTTTKTKRAELQMQNVTCLGIKKDSLAFVGMCTDTRSTCKSRVSSRSLDCGSSSICCQVRQTRYRFGLVGDFLCCRTVNRKTLESDLLGKFCKYIYV